MSKSKSSKRGSGRDQRPTVTLDAELANRLVAALEHRGAGGFPPGGGVDPVRARASRDYEVLRGMLGRADAPTPLRMRRRPIFFEGKHGRPDGRKANGGDNRVEILDRVPLAARYALVESLGDGSTSAVTDRVPISGGYPPPTLLLLRDVRAALPISRVEIFDAKDRLVAFGPSFAPLPQPQYKPSGG
ncbi:MAG: hypothetical protein ABW022_23715 [Actinoplanes sp.]